MPFFKLPPPLVLYEGGEVVSFITALGDKMSPASVSVCYRSICPLLLLGLSAGLRKMEELYILAKSPPIHLAGITHISPHYTIPDCCFPIHSTEDKLGARVGQRRGNQRKGEELKYLVGKRQSC